MSIDVAPAAESGNGRVVEVGADGSGWRVFFLSEARTSPQPLWFHLDARGLEGKPVRFVWQNADGCLGSPKHLHKVRPVARPAGGEWSRLSALRVDERPDGRRVPSFFCPGGSDELSVAFCFPYGPRALEETLGETGGVWMRELIGVSGNGRPLERLRLSAKGAEKRPGVFFTARNHAGETPGSWVLDGILRFLASEDDEARGLRESLDCWAVPFVDIDGVVEGDYGKDAFPWDFNRSWSRLPMRPEVLSCEKDMLRFKALTSKRVVIDLHAPGHAEDGPYMFFPRRGRPSLQREAVRRFGGFLAERIPGMRPEKLLRECTYASRYNATDTATNWAWDNLEPLGVATVETSYQSLQGKVAGVEDYRRFGRQVALAVGDWLEASPDPC